MLHAAIHWYEVAGDTNNVIGETATLGWMYAQIGQLAQSTSMLRATLQRAREQRAKSTITFAMHSFAHALLSSADAAEREEGAALLPAILSESVAAGNARVEGWTRSDLAELALAEGRHAEAEEQARLAETRHARFVSLHPRALAIHARTLLALGAAHHDEALAQVRRAMRTLEGVPGLPLGEALPPLVLVECLRAHGRHDDAAIAARDAVARLERRAASIANPEWRASFLALPTSRATLALIGSQQ
jgi:hypothetical protein